MLTTTKPNEIDWETCYQKLTPRVTRLVSQMRMARWRGEERDVVEDIVQDTMRKLFEYTLKVAEGQEKPVQTVEGMLYTIARNCLLDRRRREIKLCAETAYIPPTSTDVCAHLSDVATENVYQEGLFTLLAQKIALFPAKQRAVLLTDLASRMTFDRVPTMLQAAFRAEGIYLEEYRDGLPDAGNKSECNRYAALLYQAIQRLKGLKDQDLQMYLDLDPDLKLANEEEKPTTLQTVFQAEEMHFAEYRNHQARVQSRQELNRYTALPFQINQRLEEEEQELCFA